MMRLFMITASVILSACSHVQELKPDPHFAALEIADPEISKPENGAIYNPEYGIELFRDQTAYRTGDVLSVVLSEATSAQTSASTNTTKDDEVDIGAPVILGYPITKNDLSATVTSSAGREFSGTGDSAQSNSLSGEISVTVHQVLPNGNLLVRGEKILRINQGAEYVRLSGLVRLRDIRADNTVLSGKIANAQISYGGKGALAQSNQQGWLSRFFSSEYWPF